MRQRQLHGSPRALRFPSQLSVRDVNLGSFRADSCLCTRRRMLFLFLALGAVAYLCGLSWALALLPSEEGQKAVRKAPIVALPADEPFLKMEDRRGMWLHEEIVLGGSVGARGVAFEMHGFEERGRYWLRVDIDLRRGAKNAVLRIRADGATVATFRESKRELVHGPQRKTVALWRLAGPEKTVAFQLEAYHEHPARDAERPAPWSALYRRSLRWPFGASGEDRTHPLELFADRVRVYSHEEGTVLPSPLCAIVRTYHKQEAQLMALLTSLGAAGGADLTIYVVDTEEGTPPEKLRRFGAIVRAFNEMSRRRSARLVHGDALRGGVPMPCEDFGYMRTDVVMKWLLKERACDKLLVTNGDNLYSRHFFAAVREELVPIGGSVAAATSFVHSYPMKQKIFQWYPRWPFRPLYGSYRDGINAEYLPDFHRKRIDLGCFVLDAAFLAATGLNFLLNDIEKGNLDVQRVSDATQQRVMQADGVFAANVKRYSKGRVSVVPRTLFIHQ